MVRARTEGESYKDEVAANADNLGMSLASHAGDRALRAVMSALVEELLCGPGGATRKQVLQGAAHLAAEVARSEPDLFQGLRA